MFAEGIRLTVGEEEANNRSDISRAFENQLNTYRLKIQESSSQIDQKL